IIWRGVSPAGGVGAVFPTDWLSPGRGNDSHRTTLFGGRSLCHGADQSSLRGGPIRCRTAEIRTRAFGKGGGSVACGCEGSAGVVVEGIGASPSGFRGTVLPRAFADSRR